MFPRIRTASSYLLPLRMIPADDPLKFSLLFFFFSFPSFRSPNRVFRGTIKAPLTGVWPGSPALVKRSQARTATQRKMIIRSDLFDLELALTFNARPVRPPDPLTPPRPTLTTFRPQGRGLRGRGVHCSHIKSRKTGK